MKKIALAFLLFPLCLLAQTPSITVTPVITGLSRPIYATHCGDSRLFVVEQAGRIKVYDSAYNYLGIYLNVSNIVTQPATGGDERGLLGLAFHPNYTQNGYFYINYTRTVNGQLKSFITRYSVFANNTNKADSLSALEILSFNQPYSNHNGGCLAFGPDGYLYIGTGDGGSGNDPQGNGQKLNTYLAKMLRIDVNNGTPYTVPTDNPFVGTANVNPEIWAYGLRNPWRFSFDRINGNLWIADVGQNNYEEVNVHYNGDPAGDNYGWRCFEGTNSSGLGSGTTGLSCPNYNDTHKPIYEYTHSGGECSVTGGYVYRGALYNSMFGDYLCTDYCSGKIRQLIENGDGTFTPEIIYDGDFTVSFAEDRWGELYICSATQSAILKISDGNCEPVAYITNGDTAAICAGQSVQLKALQNPALSYAWYQNGNVDVLGTTSTFDAISTGEYYVVVSTANGCSSISPNITVVEKPLPDVQINLFGSVCANESPVSLEGTPSGGSFSGSGVTGNTFDPVAVGAGAYEITYTYTEPNGCTNTASGSVTVDPLPEVNFVNLPDTVCTDVLNSEITLQAQPAGGVFSGNGIKGNILTLSSFNTTYGVTYTYTQPKGCTNTITDSIYFRLCTGVNDLLFSHTHIFPSPTTGIIFLQTTLSNLTFELYNTSGQLLISKIVSGNESLNIANQPAGLYFYRLVQQNEVKTGKIELTR